MYQLLAKKTLDAINGGQFKTAQKHAQRGIKQYPTRPEFANFAGIAAGAQGKPKEAVACFQRALRIAPGFQDARRNLAQTLILMQRPEPALSQLETLLKEDPKDKVARYLKAQAFLAMGNPQSALDEINVLIEPGPGTPRDLTMRARIKTTLGDEGGALQDLEKILAIEPNHIETLVAISQPLARAGRIEEAESAIRKAVQLAPQNTDALLRLAAHLEETGQIEAAAETCLSALALKPDLAAALELLARLKGAEHGERLAADARKALKSATYPSIERASLHFALASVAKASGSEKDFSQNLEKANANMAALQPYNAAYEENLTDALIARFSPGTPVAEDAAHPFPRPIFVVGLPRSGTTLTELTLAGNSRVWPLGELSTAGRLLAPVIDQDLPFDTKAQAAFASGYVAELPPESNDAIARVDKMPENYRLLGFLITALPGCRIVNLRRDPRDLALSLWQAHFSGSALSYAYDLGSMAHRFNQYARLMNHWNRVFGERVLDIRYEDLVGDISSTSRRIAEFCEVEWSEEMTRPYASARSVLTLSATQVRQPVHTRSVGGWRRHAEMLDPFVERLDKSLWPELD